MRINEARVVSETKDLLDHYDREFLLRYRVPHISEDDDAYTLRFIVEKLGMEPAKKTVTAYFKLRGNGGNDWFESNAHSLKVLKANLNYVNSQAGLASEVYYVVGLTTHGDPVVSRNSDALKGNGFTVLTLEEWRKKEVEAGRNPDGELEKGSLG